MVKILPLTVIILTKDEEVHLRRCLVNVVPWAEKVFVVDSGSTDRTQEIAREYGAEVHEHVFRHQADQFNWALDRIPIKSQWILRLDADEYLLPELWKEIAEKLQDVPMDVSGFAITRRVIFMGRWIRRGGYYPTSFVRLFRNGKGRYEDREMDEHLIVDGRVENLAYDFVDHNVKGLKEFIARHNSYSTREARAYAREQRANGKEQKAEKDAQRMALHGQAYATRKLKNEFYYHLPPFFRAILYFKYRYFLRLGFLDGIPGLIFHFLQGLWHRFLIDAKIYEMRDSRGGDLTRE